MKTDNKQQKIERIVKDLSDALPHFPDGRINYSGSKKAAILTCFVKYKDKILLLKRSDKVSTYQGMWNTVAGYIDEIVPIEDKVREELKEELRIEKIDNIRIGKIYEFFDRDIDKTWVIVPCLVELGEYPIIRLDSEHTEYKWIKPEEIENYFIVPNLKESLNNAL